MHYIMYHIADLDGHCSCAIVDRYLKNEPRMYLPYNYGNPIASAILTGMNAGDVLWLVDISAGPEIISFVEAAENDGVNIIWIDHHKTTLPYFGKYNGIISSSDAACLMTWHYCFPDTMPPVFVQMLSDYDSWKNTDQYYWDNDVLPFQYGMRSYQTDPSDDNVNIWQQLFDDKTAIFSILDIGKGIYQYIKKQNSLASKNAYPVIFNGISTIALNIAGANSLVFDSLPDLDRYDLMAAYHYTPRGTWKVSLYTSRENIDCEAIAKQYGGGGHKKAAGFHLDSIEALIAIDKAREAIIDIAGAHCPGTLSGN